MNVIVKVLVEKKVKLLLISAIILYILESLTQVLGIYLQKDLIEIFINKGDFSSFVNIMLLIGAALLLQILFFAAGPYISHINQTFIEKVMATSTMSAVYKIPLQKFNQERFVKYSYIFSNDIPNVAYLVSTIIPRFIQLIISLGIITYLYYSANLAILIMLVAVSILQILIGNHYARKSISKYEEVQTRRSNLLVHLEDCISGSREVIAYHRFNWEKNKFFHLFEKLYKAILKEWKVNNNGLIASDVVKWMAISSYFAYGCTLVISNQMSLGLFVVLFQFSSIIMDSIQALFNTFMEMIRNYTSAKRIERALIELDKDTGRGFNEEITKIEFCNVCFSYDSNNELLIRNLSFSIPKGEKVAFVGASGCGKSTLVNLLVQNYSPTKGSILINGIPLNEIDSSDWYGKVAVVFQDTYFFPDTIRNNLLLGRNKITDEEMIRACKASAIHEYINNLENRYDTVIGERGITLSGGQRQRLAIARALLGNPELLILDEATSSLDVETERIVQSNIDSLRTNRTTVIIAHRLSTIQNSSIIYVLHQGDIAESGTHDELIQKGKDYNKLFLAGQVS
ncbi:ABC transporter ATP-binding protein [Paenibacillus sp. KS-LC4]|uniref:ABC transporter ATP-binding protein n=1 Tax=Paenibacillus sp. KS-LC4 TaxID=2979727 RepID=UPI0030CE1A49